MRWRIPIVVVLALFVAVSCDQQPVEPVPEQVAEAPTFDFSNGPAQPGYSNILRGEWVGDFFTMIDPATELMVLVSWADHTCIEFDEATPIPWQTIFSPADANLEMYFEAGWLNALLLEPPYTCADVIATGKVHNRGHDNAGWQWDGEHNRTQSLGFRFNGRLGDHNVKWSLQCLWGGLTRPDFHEHCNETVSFR